MKKSFYFALALTAGLFASCSSDDLSQAPQQSLNVNDSELAEINIEVAKPNATTRGTGAVGVKDNKWEGQDFQLFMFEKGTLTLATYEDETHAMVPIFDNYNMTTRADGSGNADYWIADPADPTNTVIQYNYFPTSGSYSFWGYRIDDAWVDGAGLAGYEAGADPATKVVNGVGDATATEVTVPFKIDGTQDLMIAETKESDAATQLKGVVTTLSDDEAAAKIYSAYAARRGVNPKLQFSHLLSRLYFEVKAGDRDVSDAATIKTTDPAEYAGFRITSVKVKSKSKGYIVAAYKDAIPAAAQRLVWDDGDADPTNDETWPAATADDAKTRWNNEATLATFELKSREKVVDEKAQVALVSRSLGAADFNIPATYDFGSGTPVAVANGGTAIVFGDETPVYTVNTLDGTTGLPTTAPVTRKTLLEGGHLGTETIYYLIVRDGNHDGTTVAWNKPTYTEDPSQPLKATLDEVTPMWSSDYAPATKGVPTWRELVQAATLYTWTEQPAYVVAGGEVDLGANTLPDSDPAVAGVYALNDVVFTDWGGVVRYFKLTAIAYNTDGVPDVADHTTVALSIADIDTKKVHDLNDGKYYEVYGVGGTQEVPGHAEATPIGESLLVAPNGDTGHYLIEIGFKRTKKITSDKVQELNGTAYLAPSVTSGKFEAGKSYKITLVLYSDGEIKSEGYTIINWTDGTSDLTEPEYEL